MLETVRSGSSTYNPHFVELPRQSQGNLDWFRRAIGDCPGDKAVIALTGSKSTTALRLRMAQAEAREDLLPSDWSHAFAILGEDIDQHTPIAEVPLHETSALGFPPTGNAVIEGILGNYRDRKEHPNLAVLFIPTSTERLRESIERFKGLRTQIDAVQLKARWLPYLWGVGKGRNPLHEGFGIPSAAFVEALAAAHDFELTPGLASSSSCPEAIWQAARWWHEYHEQVGGPRGCIHGFYNNAHHLA